jgi:hypothetical protein
VTEQSTGKGRPTPKRSEAQKRRTGPVVPPPTNRREAAKQLRAKQAENRKRIKAGSLVGDESALLPRDRGPVRRLVRDFVDSRRTLGWLLMPMAIVVFASSFIRNESVRGVVLAAWFALVAAALVEGVMNGFAISRAVHEAFPDEGKWKGHVRYGVMRALTVPRLRVPRPTVR